MELHSLRQLAATLALTALPTTALADEGMWTFDAFPSAAMKRAYGFAPDQAWLDHTRLSAARLTGGCSSSFVSAEGLLLTNHHCVVPCAQALSSAEHDFVKDGFLADDRAKEGKCPGQQAEVVTDISDVTPRVKAAIGTNIGAALIKARDAEIARIEASGCPDKEKTRCQVVTLYGGGQYKLYAYRKYSDIRLVFAPEYAVGQFGGDPDNFNFPRYGLDAAFLRAYEDGRPISTPTHLRWNPTAPAAGEIIFVVGNPGSTQRLFTMRQIETRRDLAVPTQTILLSEERGRLLAATEQDAEKARTGAEQLASVENSFKVLFGRLQALDDRNFTDKLASNETALRAKVAANLPLALKVGDPWQQIADADGAYRELFIPYLFLEAHSGWNSTLYSYASTLVRAAIERAKPDVDRLPDFNDAALPLLSKQLLDPQPVYPWLEKLELEMWLSKAREYLTANDPRITTLLGREAPESIAARLVAGTKLADPGVRKALYDGGLAAVRGSQDPMIQLALRSEPMARAVLDEYRARVDAPITAAQSKLAEARFAIYGQTLYPDATFTLRMSYGPVQGWTERGSAIKPTTTFAGLFDRATGQPPFALPASWLSAKPRLNLATVLDFSTGNDVIGGNSGSPAIARDGSVVGALFDGNIHSLGGNFGYDPTLNRSVIVAVAAVDEALAKVYRAMTLLAELHAEQ